MGLDHVALSVTDRARSHAFYAEHFGMSDVVHDDTHLLILADATGALLALSTADRACADALPRTNHFGFRARSADDVRAARERFRAAGLSETEWQEGGPTRCQVLDPDGYRVELYAM